MITVTPTPGKYEEEFSTPGYGIDVSEINTARTKPYTSDFIFVLYAYSVL